VPSLLISRLEARERNAEMPLHRAGTRYILPPL
jgi:hypothetical protein